MNWDEYARWGKEISDWGSDYHKTLRDRPVRAQVAPGDIAALLSLSPPEQGEDMAVIMEDFERVVMPGITHWQHPRFFAYFPSNASPPAILADFLTSTMAVNSLLWQTSPAATEMDDGVAATGRGPVRRFCRRDPRQRILGNARGSFDNA